MTQDNSISLKLQESANQLGRLFESSRDAVILCDFSGKVKFTNPSASELFSVQGAQEEVSLQSLLNTKAWRSSIDEKLKKAVSEGSARACLQDEASMQWELSFLRVDFCDPQFIQVTVHAHFESFEDKDIHRAVDQLESLVDQRTNQVMRANRTLKNEVEQRMHFESQYNQSRAQLYHAEKMALLGQMTAGILHEVNNPIAYVSSNLETLSHYLCEVLNSVGDYRSFISRLTDAEGTDLGGTIQALIEFDARSPISDILHDLPQLLAESTEGLRRVTDIVQDMRNFGRWDPAALEYVDIHELLEDALRIANVELSKSCSIVRDWADLPKIRCYPGQLLQVFLNLLVNASQAVGDKGCITITTRLIDDRFHVMVLDDGPGVAVESREKIFEPFYTTKTGRGGTGLGLWLSREIVERHGGNLDLSASAVRGACFTVDLPRDPRLCVEEISGD